MPPKSSSWRLGIRIDERFPAVVLAKGTRMAVDRRCLLTGGRTHRQKGTATWNNFSQHHNLQRGDPGAGSRGAGDEIRQAGERGRHGKKR